MTESIAVVGGGIAGLAAAHHIVSLGADVTVYEANDVVGGRIRSSPFAGLEQIDEGADAFLARVPEAIELAAKVGFKSTMVHPEAVGAAIWHGGLHPIPDGLLLGVPGEIRPLATTGLLSWKGKLRAGLEPLLPRTSTASDSIGEFVRARFGNEVHERLVDALVGSIYAADTDRFSLAEVPQLEALARSNRSMLIAARHGRQTSGTATASAAPVFAAPRSGMADLCRATADAVISGGGRVRTGHAVESIESAGTRWVVDGQRFDAVIMATPAANSASALAMAAPETAAGLAQAETADVIMVTLHVSDGEWPERLHGRSGYLVPKPVQRWVTAASFGSQKWGHWQPPGGGQILRVSLGRDAQPVLHLTDEEVLNYVLDDLDRHLGARLSPLEVRVTRWPAAFAQYRPHHGRWVDSVEQTLPDGLFVAGAGYRGIGVPACIRQGTTIGQRAVDHTRSLQQ